MNFPRPCISGVLFSNDQAYTAAMETNAEALAGLTENELDEFLNLMRKTISELQNGDH